MLLNSAITL